MRVVPRGVTASGHRPLSVVIDHMPRVFIGITGRVTEERARGGVFVGGALQ